MDTHGTTHAPAILVTGGSGTLGRHVVARLQARGRPVRVLSRGRHPIRPAEGVTFVTGDLSTGAGVASAVAGVETVINLAGSQQRDDVKAGHLVAAAKAAGVRHLVHISVVGADRVPQVGRIDRSAFGYFGSKRAAEQVIEGSALPWTILRATQFFDLTFATVAALSKLPIVPVPARLRFQPIDSNRWPNGSSSWPWAGRRAWCRNSPGRERTPSPTSSGRTSGRPDGTGSWCRCGFPGRPRPRSARAPRSRRTGPSAGGRGRTSWRSPSAAIPTK